MAQLSIIIDQAWVIMGYVILGIVAVVLLAFLGFILWMAYSTREED